MPSGESGDIGNLSGGHNNGAFGHRIAWIEGLLQWEKERGVLMRTAGLSVWEV